MKYERIFTGQKMRYGDFFREFKITDIGNASLDDVKKYCLSTMMEQEHLPNKENLPDEAAYLTNIRSHNVDMPYYVTGCYRLVYNNFDKSYSFTIIEPYAD